MIFELTSFFSSGDVFILFAGGGGEAAGFGSGGCGSTFPVDLNRELIDLEGSCPLVAAGLFSFPFSGFFGIDAVFCLETKAPLLRLVGVFFMPVWYMPLYNCMKSVFNFGADLLLILFLSLSTRIKS